MHFELLTYRGLNDGEISPKYVTDYYRVVNREMVNPSWVRTLSTALIPKEVAGSSVVATAFRYLGDCVDFAATSMSIVLDFFIKSTATGHVRISWLNRLPLLLRSLFAPSIRSGSPPPRPMPFSCLTTHYADLWEEVCATPLDRRSVSRPYRRIHN